MPLYGTKVKVTRTASPVGPVVIVHVPGVSRIGQVYSQESPQGTVEFFAWVTTGYGPSGQPQVERVPRFGGCSTLEELEETLVTGGK